MTTWTVYMVRCADDTLYTGIAKDAARRIEEHNSNDLLGSRYTRARRPVVLVYQDVVATRSDALKHEYRIKQMSRKEKDKLIEDAATVVTT
jgi:putative endonuclease